MSKRLWKVLGMVGVLLLGAIPAFAQCTPNTIACANFAFTAAGTAHGAYDTIPSGTTTINAQIVSDAITGSYTAQIETASSISGGALVSPVNCGASVAVGTSAGSVTATCNASASQPWTYVAVVLSGGTGSGHGTITFLSSLMGSNANSIRGQPASFVIKCLTAPVAHTGDTGNDIVEVCKIPAGTLQVGSIVEISTALVTASTNTGSLIAYIDLGTGPTTPTINPIWTSAIAANKAVTQGTFCTFSASATVQCAGQNALGYNAAAQPNSAGTLSVAADVYVLIYMQNSVAADTSYLQQLFVRVTV